MKPVMMVMVVMAVLQKKCNGVVKIEGWCEPS